MEITLFRKIEGFEHLTNLQVLNLEENEIEKVPVWLVKRLRSLRAVKLARNSISSVSPYSSHESAKIMGWAKLLQKRLLWLEWKVSIVLCTCTLTTLSVVTWPAVDYLNENEEPLLEPSPAPAVRCAAPKAICNKTSHLPLLVTNNMLHEWGLASLLGAFFLFSLLFQTFVSAQRHCSSSRPARPAWANCEWKPPLRTPAPPPLHCFPPPHAWPAWWEEHFFDWEKRCTAKVFSRSGRHLTNRFFW